MKNLTATLTIAAVVAATSALSAAELGRGGTTATLESAPTATGDKTYLKSVPLDCQANACVAPFKGKAGRTTTITEIQCALRSTGQAQGGQVSVAGVFLEMLPIASRASDGVEELAIVKTQTNFTLEGTQKADLGIFFYGDAEFGTCIVKGISKSS